MQNTIARRRLILEKGNAVSEPFRLEDGEMRFNLGRTLEQRSMYG